MTYKHIKTFFFLLLFVLVVIIGSSYIWFKNLKSIQFQAKLEPFYSTPVPQGGKLGDIISSESLNLSVPYGKGYRILYISELSTGEKVATSGMIFIPSKKAPNGGRPIVAWSHGTIGMASFCSPSRSSNPLSNMSWLGDFLEKGYVVVATDYYGLGTPGVERYLIGQDQGRDVLNSLRAAIKFPKSNASSSYSLWGQSQGGHAALFAANMSIHYVPELNLVSVAVAAPAVELSALLSQQYGKVVSWIIGPEIAVSWPLVYSNLKIDEVVSSEGVKNYKKIAYNCVGSEIGQAIIREDLKESFFKVDPVEIASWKKALEEQTPLPLSSQIPLLIVQSLSDSVVLPNTTALFNKKSCDAGSNISLMWIQDVSHEDTAKVAGPVVAEWLDARFNSVPVQSTCSQPFPVAAFKD